MKEFFSFPVLRKIIQDLFANNKLVLLLIFLLLMTTLAVILVTNSTRLLINEKNDLMEQHQSLENEQVNLRLEETVLVKKNNIEKVAKEKLHMHSMQLSDEVIVVK